jgi:hypothetical protein
MSEHDVYLRGSHGEGMVHLAHDAHAYFGALEGDITLEGPWLHIKAADGQLYTLPSSAVVGIAWSTLRQAS